MKTHKILIIILLVLAACLGMAISKQNSKDKIVSEPEPYLEFLGTTTIPVATTTVKATTTKPVIIPTQTFPKQIVLTLLNSYTFPNGVILKVKELVSDSRCPTDVQCFWAGNVVVKFMINNKEFELTYGPGGTMTSYPYNEYLIWFEGVQPDKGASTKAITPGEYSFIMNIQKK